jgi:hypothetical protein
MASAMAALTQEAVMRKAALLGIVGALGLGLVASSAVAAPVGGVALQIEPPSLVEKIHLIAGLLITGAMAIGMITTILGYASLTPSPVADGCGGRRSRRALFVARLASPRYYLNPGLWKRAEAATVRIDQVEDVRDHVRARLEWGG